MNGVERNAHRALELVARDVSRGESVGVLALGAKQSPARIKHLQRRRATEGITRGCGAISRARGREKLVADKDRLLKRDSCGRVGVAKILRHRRAEVALRRRQLPLAKARFSYLAASMLPEKDRERECQPGREKRGIRQVVVAVDAEREIGQPELLCQGRGSARS